MAPTTQRTLQHFIQGRHLSVAEIRELRQLFSDHSKAEEINEWLTGNWMDANSNDLEISYDGLKQKLLHYENSRKGRIVLGRPFTQFAGYYRRIAAVLFIPLILGLSVYLFFSSSDEVNFYLSEAPLGQKARIELPDGSKVWLNSGSSIRYSSDFNRKDRIVELKGEGFFEVEKNTGKPFLVHTPFLDVKVMGTVFNVNAYSDESTIETSLVEGSVILLPAEGDKLFRLTPGQVMSFSKTSSVISTSRLDEDAAIGWKDNRLIFINDDFSKLVRKIEKWYNIEVVYDPDEFKGNKLTVKLLEGEQLPRLLGIIEAAIGAKCTMRDNKIIITKIN